MKAMKFVQSLPLRSDYYRRGLFFKCLCQPFLDCYKILSNPVLRQAYGIRKSGGHEGDITYGFSVRTDVQDGTCLTDSVP